MKDIAAIEAVHARIPAAGYLPGGWMEAYRQDVGALLARVDELEADLAALRHEHEAQAALLLVTRHDLDLLRAMLWPGEAP